MSIELELRDLFEADAAAAPSPAGLAEAARRKARHQAHVRRIALLGAIGTVAAVAVAVPMLNRTAAEAPPLARTEVAGSVPAGKAGQPLPEDGSASCVRGYSPQAIAQYADFAFDGTVTAIGRSTSNRTDEGDLPDLVGVTLHVNEWFKGGRASNIVVDMPGPSGATFTDDGEGAPVYAVGTRLLVSGAARWGGTDPLKDAIAWWGCGGFTRYYSPGTAAAWAAAIR